MAAEVILLENNNLLQPSYNSQQESLIGSSDIPTILNSGSYIEFYVLNNNYQVLDSNPNYLNYRIENDNQSTLTNQTSKIIVNPELDLNNLDYSLGEYLACYKFYNSEIDELYISEISSDRTEIRLDNNRDLEGLNDIINQTQKFINKRNDSSYFIDFYLNFGNNNIVLANNIILDDDNIDNITILVKLYEPLPDSYSTNTTLNIVTTFQDPITYKVTFEDPPLPEPTFPKLKGPNFNIDLKDQVNNSTLTLSYSDLITSKLTSSKDEINSFLKEKEIQINVDYTKFNNFTHFSSAQTRLENFYYKIGLIEQYSSSIATLNSTTSSPITLSGSKATFQSKISEIIDNFDGYDKFLYYESSSFSYPKTNQQKPYLLAKSTSTEVLTWLGNTDFNSVYYGGKILSASLFDEQNQNGLYYSIPEYLREDPANDQYKIFVDMVAQHYDNIWIYYRDVSQKFNADNRLKHGVSKDIVSDAIKEFGVKLYQNNFSNDDLYTAFLGLTPDGGLFPFPNITSSLPTPTGFEYIDTLISASNDIIPLDDVNKSLYKRIYHNIPYLLKSKGTIPGLRALITSYGIPDTILRINEYGGKDKININDWDHWQNEFNYAFSTTGSNFISSSWGIHDHFPSAFGGGPNSVNNQIMFRFKTNGLPTSNIPRSQSLWYLSGSGQGESAITLRYEGTAYDSASYNGSIKDPYYQYAYLDFYPDLSASTTISASVYLPFFDGEWWSVAASRDNNTSKNFTLRAANKLYKGGDNNTKIGFISSSTVNYTSSVDSWRRPQQISYFPASSSLQRLTTYTPFSGSYQEIRYYAPPISENVFRDYVMNPYSIEGNTINSSPNELTFRASLGGELSTSSISIHPKITGSWVPTQSFSSSGDGFSNFHYNITPIFLPNTEFFFTDQPIAGIKNIVKDKIRIENNVIPEGNTLSPYMSLSQMANISQSYTPNINYLEVAFSPQNEVNEDIMSQIGFFDIGEYIGDPRLRSSSATLYPDLDNLRDDYFEKYTKNYNLKDFIRLIKFFDNSLFKMIKDFVPARTSLASGIVIKQHLLERNKYPQPQLSFENKIYTGSIDMVEISGSTGGTFNEFNGINNRFGITQSWSETVPTLSGSVVKTYSNQDEFYDGIFSGSQITVSTQDLNAHCNKYKKVSSTGITYTGVRIYSGSDYLFNEWSKDTNHPTNGYISMWYQNNNNVNVPLLPLEPINDFVPGTGTGGFPPADPTSEDTRD
tara:strand:- start:2479 stop:6156 length:3678 start_codon:yes stop_codon:yes gene_type:complete